MPNRRLASDDWLEPIRDDSYERWVELNQRASPKDATEEEKRRAALEYLVGYWSNEERTAHSYKLAAIRKMHDDGASLRDIGKAAGYSATAIANMLKA